MGGLVETYPLIESINGYIRVVTVVDPPPTHNYTYANTHTPHIHIPPPPPTHTHIRYKKRWRRIDGEMSQWVNACISYERGVTYLPVISTSTTKLADNRAPYLQQTLHQGIVQPTGRSWNQNGIHIRDRGSYYRWG